MKMEKSGDDKFIKFNSEVALRKENKGGIINTLLDNVYRFHSSTSRKHLYKFKFGHVFTKKELGDNEKSESGFFWDEGFASAPAKLHLETPENSENVWYDSNLFIHHDRDSDAGHQQEDIAFSVLKEWSGVGISDETREQGPGIFENLEIWGNRKEYSEIFYKHETSIGDSAGSGSAYQITDPHTKTGFDNSSAGNSTGTGESKVTPASIDIREKIKEMINSIKDLKGNGMDLNEVCGWRGNRNIDNYRLDKLRMYCSK